MIGAYHSCPKILLTSKGERIIHHVLNHRTTAPTQMCTQAQGARAVQVDTDIHIVFNNYVAMDACTVTDTLAFSSHEDES